MRIGFDGRWFFSGNPSGRLIARQLLRQLILHHPEHEYVVFLPRRERHLEFPLPAPHVRCVYARGANGLLANCLFLPWQARKLGLDACLFFYFSSWLGAYRKIVLINDITFLAAPEFFSWKEKLYFRPIRRLSRHADLILTLSESEKRRMIRRGFAGAGRIGVMPLGVDGSFAPLSGLDADRVRAVRAAYRLPERFLLYVGRLNERKNIQHLLQSLQALEDRDIELILAGAPDWKMFDLDARIRGLGLQGRVRLLGRVGESDLPALYALATVFCYVSFAEGFGLPPLEAMASGVPVVVSNRDSLPEVCDGAGTYVDPENPAGIAAAIDSLLRDEGLWRKKRDLGLQRAGLFSWRRSADMLLRACAGAGRG